MNPLNPRNPLNPTIRSDLSWYAGPSVHGMSTNGSSGAADNGNGCSSACSWNQLDPAF